MRRYLGRHYNAIRYEYGGRCNICGVEHTAWQWVAKYHRKPKDDAVAHSISYDFWDPDDYSESYATWYYYYRDETEPLTVDEYKRLKEMYVQMYGGWETIDLADTIHDGRIWWVDNPPCEQKDDSWYRV